MKPAATLALTAAAALGVGYLVGHMTNPTPKAPTPAPGPQPNGGLLPPIHNPQFDPNQPPPPATNVDALRAYVAQVLQQAQTNPQSVDPTYMDQAAAELNGLGLTPEAAQLTAAAAAVRLARGQVPAPPAPNPPAAVPAPVPPQSPVVRPPLQTLGRLPAELADQMRIAMSSPGANPAAVRALAQQIHASFPGAGAEVATLLQHADSLALGSS